MRRGFLDKPAKKQPSEPKSAPTAPAPATPAPSTSRAPPAAPTTSLAIARNELPRYIPFPIKPTSLDNPFWSFISADSSQAEPNAFCVLYMRPSSLKLSQPMVQWIKSGAAQATTSLGPSANYEIKKIQGKGLGVVAKKALAKGSLVFEDWPLLVYDQEHLDPNQREAVLQHALSHLSPKRQNEFKTLANTVTWLGFDIRGHCVTNQFGDVTAEPGTQPHSYTGVYKLLSRVNHSCNPNAYHSRDASGFMNGLRAGRDIARGEEITLIYLGDLMKRAERKAQLSMRYQFDCRCEWCTMSDAESAEHDKRIDWFNEYKRSTSR